MNFSKITTKTITTKTARVAFLSAVAVMAIVSVSQHAAAQQVIDEFTSGLYNKSLSTGTVTNTQTGTMAGGSRMIIFTACEPANPCAADPYGQPNSYQIKKVTKTTGIFIFNTGYKSAADLLLYYGVGSPMSLDLSAYDRIRLFFDGANLEGVNFNFEVNNDGSSGAVGCNFTDPNGQQNPFTVDIPFANLGIPTPLGDVTSMLFEFDAAQGINTGADWAITSIQAVSGATGGDIQCGSTAN